MQPDSVEVQEFARLFSSFVQRFQPSAEVTLTEEGFLGDVLYARISLAGQRRPYHRVAIRERGPAGTYGQVRVRPVNLLMTAEWAHDFMADPGRYLSTLERVISQAIREPQAVAFWLLTTGGLEEMRVGTCYFPDLTRLYSLETLGVQHMRVGTGIVGLSEDYSDDYIEELADKMAIGEGRREFAIWLSAYGPGDDDGDNP